MLQFRSLLIRLVPITLVVCLCGFSARAQTAPIRLEVDDDVARAGTLTPLRVYFENEGDSISAFQFTVTLDRPDLVTFENDLSGHLPVVVDGTLVNGWEYVQAQRLDGSTARVTAVASTIGTPPVAILPFSTGILIKLMAQVACEIPDTLSDRTVTATIDPSVVYFSDRAGDLIEPVSLLDGAITVAFTQNGDLDGDGFHTALDLGLLVDALFAGGSLGCPTYVSDLNCDGFPDAIDLALLIDYMLSGGPAPLPCSH